MNRFCELEKASYFVFYTKIETEQVICYANINLFLTEPTQPRQTRKTSHQKWLGLVISFIAELRASRVTLGDEALFQSLEVSVF